MKIAHLLMLVVPSSAFVTPSVRTRDTRLPDSVDAVKRARTGSLNAAALFSPLGSLGVVATIVLVHEAGHYLAARSLKMKVDEFSIGVGPKLFGFTAFGNDFSLRGLPIGGYVKFPEHYDIVQAQKDEYEAMKTAGEFLQQKIVDPRSQMLNTLSLGALGDKEIRQENEKRNAEISRYESLPWWRRLNRRRPKQPIVVPSEFEVEYYNDPALLQNRPWQQRGLVMIGGIAFNFILAFSIYFGMATSGKGVPRVSFGEGVVVSSIVRPEAPAIGVLSPGDVILKSNGVALTSPRPTKAEAQRGVNDFVNQVRSVEDDASLQLQILHEGAKKPSTINIKPSYAPNTNVKSIGASLTPNAAVDAKRGSTVLESVRLAAKCTTEEIQETAAGIGGAIFELVKGSDVQGLSGPIGVLQTGNKVVSTQSLETILLFSAALSINLGVVNALPLPGLDGGQLAFLMIEVVRGRRLSQSVQDSLTSAAVLLLLCVTIGASVGDIKSILLGR